MMDDGMDEWIDPHPHTSMMHGLHMWMCVAHMQHVMDADDDTWDEWGGGCGCAV